MDAVTPIREPAWADSDTLAAVRPEVRALLERSKGFQALEPEAQRSLAQTMVKVAAYMTNPQGLARQELGPEGGVLARAQAGVDDLKTRLGKRQDFAGADFQAGALRQGTAEFGNLVQKVDFPKFVGGLIQNVFQAIVDASIQQMQAYGELLANVAKTVDQFARDNISENNARDWLTDRFPEELGMETDPFAGGFAEGEATPEAQPRVTVVAEDVEASLRRISEELGMARPVSDISDEAEERRLVQAARLQIARMRQQLLASMVLLGINRIVVTDGLIHAKVVFDFQAKDQAARRSRAALYDSEATRLRTGAAAGGWAPWGAGGAYSSFGRDHTTTVESGVNEQSESKAELKAKLTGEVRVNFKSDYLPLEKMATPQMIAAIQGNAEPVERAKAPAQGGETTQPAA